MKTRLLIAIVALFGLFAVACGSDASIDAVTDAVSDAVESTASDAEEDAMEDEEAMADEEDAMEDEEAMADEEAMEDEEAMADEEAMVDEEEAAGDVPERIVSLSPSATEMLFAIGAGDQVVAVDSFSYFPEEAPVTDLSGFEPNIEAIAGFEPDVVVTLSLIHI